MTFEILGKVAFVTGGSSGLGYHVVKQFLQEGLRYNIGVSIVDIDDKNGNLVQEEFVREFGSNSCIFIRADVSNELQLEDSFKSTVNTFKQLDIIVNNAGVITELNWRKCLNTNLGGCIIGTTLGIDQYLHKYKSGPEGVIVNIASVVALEPWGAVPIYSASKQGILAITRPYGVKEHYERCNVKVLAVCPGQMSTTMSEYYNMDSYNVDYLNTFLASNPQFPVQTSETVEKYLVKVIREGQNGSIWVVEGNESAFEVEFPTKENMAKSKL